MDPLNQAVESNTTLQDSGLCTDFSCRGSAKDSLALEKALGAVKEAIPTETELTPEASRQLFSRLFGEAMGATVADYIQEAGVESAKIKPTADGFEVRIDLKEGVNFDVSSVAEKIIKEQGLSGGAAAKIRQGVKELSFEKLDVQETIAMKVSLNQKEGTLKVTPLAGQETIGIGFGVDAPVAGQVVSFFGADGAIYSYAKEVTISANGIQFNGTKGYSSEQAIPDSSGVQVAAKGMIAFAESLSAS